MLAFFGTTAYPILFFNGLLVCSLGLHHQRLQKSNQIAVETRPVLRNALSDWDVLKSRYKKDKALRLNVCTSKQYKKYYELLPELHLENLRLAPNVKILFYGTSYLHQVVDNLLAANIDTLIKDGPWGGAEGKNLFMEDVGGWVTTWEFETNTSILEIQNYRPFQDAQHADVLAEFLETQGPFDVAFYMDPHADCFFEGINCTFDESFDDRADVNPLWEVVHTAVGSNMFEVESWSWESQYAPKGRPSEAFHGQRNRIIRSTSLLTNCTHTKYGPCNISACNQKDECVDPALHGHQCQPGRVALIAEQIAMAIGDEHFRPL